MFLGILIGAFIWSLQVTKAHGTQPRSHHQLVATTDPQVLASVRWYGTIRLMSTFISYTTGFGAIGWVVEVLYH